MVPVGISLRHCSIPCCCSSTGPTGSYLIDWAPGAPDAPDARRPGRGPPGSRVSGNAISRWYVSGRASAWEEGAEATRRSAGSSLSSNPRFPGSAGPARRRSRCWRPATTAGHGGRAAHFRMLAVFQKIDQVLLPAQGREEQQPHHAVGGIFRLADLRRILSRISFEASRVFCQSSRESITSAAWEEAGPAGLVHQSGRPERASPRCSAHFRHSPSSHAPGRAGRAPEAGSSALPALW